MCLVLCSSESQARSLPFLLWLNKHELQWDFCSCSFSLAGVFAFFSITQLLPSLRYVMPGKSVSDGTEAWSTFYLHSGEAELLLKGKPLFIY